MLISSVLLNVCVLLQLCAAQKSCRGRCGEPFSRGQICTCDDDCLTYNECCKDYEEVCTSRGSCKGRCREAFRRGRECECDPDCTLYNSCCLDYSTHCGVYLSCPDGTFRSAIPLHAPDASADGGSVVERVPLTQDLASPPATDANIYLPLFAGPSHAEASSPAEPFTDGNGNIQVSVSFSGPVSGDPNQTSDVSEPSPGRPSTLADIAQALETANTAEQPQDQISGPDLCSGLPISGVTSPFNGSIIVFQGHFFFFLDPKTRAAGPAHNITADLGIPSPIDTAFTRCNCEGKTYIIKDDNYWSFQNGVMESGYPRSVSKDFGGLSGSIVAALPIPATRNRPETIYFFKKGGTVRKLTYPGSGPTCTGKKGKNPASAKNHQPVRLSGEINIALKWKGFPTPVTSALSMPNSRKTDGFEHYVFSWRKSAFTHPAFQSWLFQAKCKPC
ncbi:proteoglycan 4a [Silurus meridionalis]|uniref:proteoglycan 4a n=1 Tax=Silurus meridionalis TaxID=175797 RepID=UPI001EEC1933|nr:proteoglycan 4a [Silurus meridionalis]